MRVIQTLGSERWASPERYSLFAIVSLTVQLVWLARHRSWRSPWWRLGVVSGLLMLVVPIEVWEGSPGAILRVVLPMALAFNILLARHTPAFWPLVVAGSFLVFASLYLLGLRIF